MSAELDVQYVCDTPTGASYAIWRVVGPKEIAPQGAMIEFIGVPIVWWPGNDGPEFWPEPDPAYRIRALTPRPTLDTAVRRAQPLAQRVSELERVVAQLKAELQAAGVAALRTNGLRVELTTLRGGRVTGTISGEGQFDPHDLAPVAENLSVAAHSALPRPVQDVGAKPKRRPPGRKG